MILAADPHPLATYAAGCVFIALAAAVSCRILIGDVRRQRGRIWREFLANFQPNTNTGDRA